MRTVIRRFDVASRWTWATVAVLIISAVLGNFGAPDGVTDLLRIVGAFLTCIASIQSGRAYKAKEEAGA